MVTFEDVRQSREIQAYIKKADEALGALGFTDHAFAHVTKTAKAAGKLLRDLGYDERTAELGEIAGYLHDIGNVANRSDHAHSGALMAFRFLDKMGMEPEEVATIICAIGNHDEGTGSPVNEVAAALILADKSDVRRSRVRTKEECAFDIHDRVNYAVVSGALTLELEKRTLILSLEIDTEICPVMYYFEIFLERMLLCRRSANFFDLQFGLVINGLKLL